MGLQLLTWLTGLEKLEIMPMVDKYDEEYTVMERMLLPCLAWRTFIPQPVATAPGAHSKATAPVWRQLDELCDKSPLVAPMRLQRMREDRRQLHDANSQLIARVEQLQEDKQQLQAGLDTKQQTISQLVERVEQLSRENADLRIRLADVELQATMG